MNGETPTAIGAPAPDPAPPRSPATFERFPIVGIGASAGGLKALRELIEAMPDEPGVALVIVQHLDPTKKSLTPELLSKSTRMRVTQVADDPRVRPNRVYVIPPDRYLSISGGRLHLSEPDQPRGSRMAIDFFLRSLARDQQQCAVGIVLSGTGTDGTLGVKAIKAAGGLVIAQDPSTADHDGMPRGAIASGAVDHVLPPEGMPDVLSRYARQPYVELAGTADAEELEKGSGEPPPDELQAIVALLRVHGTHDFRHYKDNTLIRRTRRRMCLHYFETYEQYLEYLRSHPEELDALKSDLLISVTDFFRDSDAWKDLVESALKPIVEGKAVDDLVRVWVPGCATGEEPYSVAMLLIEELQRQEKPCQLQVFASDIDRRALERARAGRYPRTIAADVSQARLRRFFITRKDDPDHYHVCKALREAVVFAEQNLIADPPFSKLDLICCRNLLIYLKPEVQDKVLNLFHFALKQGGFLFLGTSETIGRRGDLLRTVSRDSRIYRRKGPTRYDLIDFPISPVAERPGLEVGEAREGRREGRLAQMAQSELLNLLGPSAVLVNRNRRILHIHGDVDPYLRHAPGSPTDDILEKARRGIRSRLRGAIHKTFTEKRPVVVSGTLDREGASHRIQIVVRPVHGSREEDDLALVVFSREETDPRVRPLTASEESENRRIGGSAAEPTTTTGRAADELEIDDHQIIRQLEAELAATKEDLQTTVEQYETSSEEYKAANEEVMSINEELQSTNEELETSKEELQSLNEELSTVNNQLASKVAELQIKHDDLQNLLQVSHLATICLDSRLDIRWFSREAAHLIRVKSTDIGRPISDFAHEFLDGDIDEVAREVLERLVPEEREVAANGDRWFLRRTAPYRTEDDRIGGVVITFVDITQRKEAETALRESHALSEKIIDTVREATLVLDADLHVMQANESFYRRFKASRTETVGRLIYELGNGQWNLPELRRLLENVLPENKIFNDFEVEHEFDEIGQRVMLLNGRQIDHVQLILLAIEDITDLRLAERRRGFLLQLNDAFREAGDLQAILREATSRLCAFLDCGRTLFLTVGGDTEESPEKQAIILAQRSVDLDDLPEGFPLSTLGSDGLSLLERDEDLIVDDILQDSRFKGASPSLFTDMSLRSLVVVPRLNGGQLQSLLLIGRPRRRRWNAEEISLIRDVSERTSSALQAEHAERALCESEERFRTIFDTAAVGVAQVAPDGRFLDVNRALCEIVGYEEAELKQLTYRDITHPDDLEKVEARLQRLRAGLADTFTLEKRNQRRDGSTNWVNLTVSAVRYPGGELRSFVRISQDIERRKKAEAALKRVNDSLEAQVTERTEMLSILQDVTRSANEARTVEEAMRAALERIAEHNGWQIGLVWRLAGDGSGQMVNSGLWYFSDGAEQVVGHLEPFRRVCEATRFSVGEGMVGAVMESAQTKWVDDIARLDEWMRNDAESLDLHAAIAFPVTVNGEVVAVLEFFSDRPTRREEHFLEIMPDVGIQLGHVIERKRLEKEIADATSEEQRRFGRELHDSVSQELTGIRILAETLRQDLVEASDPRAGRVQTLVEHLETAHTQIRRLSRGLVPVEVEAEGLMNALGTLAEDTAQLSGIACEFRCPQPVAVENNDVATQLYRIAQEATQNSVKHGRTRRIVIDLTTENDHLKLSIEDDGGGLEHPRAPTRASGLRLMQYRANLIGAGLDVQSRQGHGVVVTCDLPIR